MRDETGKWTQARPGQAGPYEPGMDSDLYRNDGETLKDYKQRSYMISF